MGPYVNFAWRTLAPCPLARFEAMGAAIDGQLYVMGGFTSAQLEVTTRVDRYDAATDAWIQLADLPGAQTHVGLARDPNGFVLAGGLRGWPGTTTSESYRYDPLTDTYARLPDLGAPRAALALSILGGRAHAIGGLATDGNSDADAHEMLDLAQSGGVWTNGPPLARARNHLGGAAVDGKIYVVGGRHRWDENTSNQATLSIFEPATDVWTDGAALPLGRSEIAAATFVAGTRLVVVGGSVNPATPSRDAFVYDPVTAGWTMLPPLPTPLKGAVADLMGDTVYVTTGSPTGTAPGAATFAGCCF